LSTTPDQRGPNQKIPDQTEILGGSNCQDTRSPLNKLR
jgi:hypothetical protein